MGPLLGQQLLSLSSRWLKHLYHQEAHCSPSRRFLPDRGNSQVWEQVEATDRVLCGTLGIASDRLCGLARCESYLCYVYKECEQNGLQALLPLLGLFVSLHSIGHNIHSP